MGMSTIQQPPKSIIFYNNFGNEQVEALRITNKGITANPDLPVDEAIDAIKEALAEPEQEQK